MSQQKIKNIVRVCVVGVAISGALFFPAENTFQALVSGFLFLAVFPFVVVRFILREAVSDYGLSFVKIGSRKIFQIVGISLLAIIVFLIIALLSPFTEYYFPSLLLLGNFYFFIFFSVFLGGIFALIFTAFFQGFLLFTLEKYFHTWAILLQFLCFLAFLILVGDFDWDMAIFVYSALFAGVISQISRSFLFAFLFTWIFGILSDIVLLRFF